MGEARDRPGPVRSGEELDVDALRAYLKEAVGPVEGELEIRQFRAGHSNLTYLIESGKNQWVLRRPPRGTRPKSGHNMAREFQILSGLRKCVDWVPEPVALCEDEEILGAPFFLMERVKGVILRGHDGGIDPLPVQEWRRLSQLCVDKLVEIHDVDIDEAGLSDLGRPQGYIDRQIDGWRRRWERARTDEIPNIEEVARWLDENRPGDDLSQTALIHNDFKYDNLVLEPAGLSRVLAVLDWELATVGDRRMDLGTTLGYWTEPDDDPVLLAMGLGPTALDGNLSRQEVVSRYEERTGTDLEEAIFFYIYGLFKVAVIGQQIYYRFHQGQTKDPRFGALIEAVRGLGRQAVACLESGRISRC